MSNTNNHAYKFSGGWRNKWWIIAVYDKSRKVVTYTMLDNGAGIPGTVRLKLKELIRVKMIPRGDELDSDLIKSAFMGDEKRSRTWLSWRGKGLPSIYDSLKKKRIRNLLAISNRGYFNMENGQVTELKRKFYGTLLSWEVRGQKRREL